MAPNRDLLTRESVSQAATAEVLRQALQAIDPSARLDINSRDAENGTIAYEVRIHGHHIGFIDVRRGGSLARWI